MFTRNELELLLDLLCDKYTAMNDDGCDGSFEESPYESLYVKVREKVKKAKSGA